MGPSACSEPYPTSKVEIFVKIVAKKPLKAFEIF